MSPWSKFREDSSSWASGKRGRIHTFVKAGTASLTVSAQWAPGQNGKRGRFPGPFAGRMTNSYWGALLPPDEEPPCCGMGIFVVLLPLLLEFPLPALLPGASLLPWLRVETVPVDSGEVVER